MALVYCLAALPAFGVQIALLMGAPLGKLTMGGRWPGRLPPPVRLLAAVQALLLAVLMSVVLDHAGHVDLDWPAWAVWPALALTLLSTIANLATPSRAERLLWGPLTLIMSASLLWSLFA